MGKGGLGMQVDRVANAIDTSRYNEGNRNANSMKVGARDQNTKPVEQLEQIRYTADELY